MAGNVVTDTPSTGALAPVPALIAWIVTLPVINRLGIAQRPRELVRFLKFATVGVIGMVVDFTILYLLVERVGLPVLVGNIFSFSAAVLSNFTWNRLWTFPESRSRPLFKQLGQFAIVNIMGLGINEVVLAGALVVLVRFLPAPWNWLLAKAFAIGVVLFWNYFINRKWTYKGIK